ncbi:hypothetical protein ACK3SF_00520 [Candidatus Nanosalina sp. VS9-1]|uniref:hypothetical protein n=1 Tax=Candidatus Nanosalina sp. VS9-1 TaxID=3388566 RepID=UPI0039E110C8
MVYRKGEDMMMSEITIGVLAIAIGALLAAAASGMLGNSGITAMIMSPLSEMTAGAL